MVWIAFSLAVIYHTFKERDQLIRLKNMVDLASDRLLNIRPLLSPPSFFFQEHSITHEYKLRPRPTTSSIDICTVPIVQVSIRQQVSRLNLTLAVGLLVLSLHGVLVNMDYCFS